MQEVMEDEGDATGNRALRALYKNELVCEDHLVEGGFQGMEGHLEPGNFGPEMSLLLQVLTLPCCCNFCSQLMFFSVEDGCVKRGTSTMGTDVLYGPGVHVRCALYSRVTDDFDIRVADTAQVLNGTKAIVTVEQGMIGLAIDKGLVIVLPPGMHYWDDPSIKFKEMVDLSSNIIKMGPYTLVTVEECKAAITQDNGRQRVLPGGNSYMLTHQNWTFQTWLSLKMQTTELEPDVVTTGDNINILLQANVNWVVKDAVKAAGYNVDVTSGGDSLKMICDDVKVQVMSSLASLIGAIHYGTQSTAGVNQAARTGKVPKKKKVEPELPGAVPHDDDDTASEASEQVAGFADRKVARKRGRKDDGKLGRKALWDPRHLQNAVDHANSITNRYGVDVLSINIIQAAPADKALRDIMSRGTIATVAAEETMKQARAEANSVLIAAQTQAAQARATADALLISARSEAARAQAEANAMLVKAEAAAQAKAIEAGADAEADRTRAEGAKDAGQLLAESEVATDLAMLKIAYGPFQNNKASTYFFGLEGPGELPTALLGKHMAGQTAAR